MVKRGLPLLQALYLFSMQEGGREKDRTSYSCFFYLFLTRNVKYLFDIYLHILVSDHMTTPSCEGGWESEYLVFIPVQSESAREKGTG